MIISRAEIESAISAYRTSVSKKPRATVISYDSDRYELSDGTAVLANLSTLVLDEPYYRPNLVADLQRRITEGKYFVPADQIVEKLIGRLFAEALPA